MHSQSHFYQLPTSARRSIPHTHRQCECCNDRSIDRLMAMIIAKNVIGGVLIDRHSYSLTGKVCCGWHLHTCILDCIIHYNLLFVFSAFRPLLAAVLVAVQGACFAFLPPSSSSVSMGRQMSQCVAKKDTHTPTLIALSMYLNISIDSIGDLCGNTTTTTTTTNSSSCRAL